MGFRSTFGIGILGLALAATPAVVPLASAQGEEATNCLDLIEATGGLVPNTWHNACDYAVTVKWFDQGSCSGGCAATVGTMDVRIADPSGAFDYFACRGNAGPTGYDAFGDRTWTCPTF